MATMAVETLDRFIYGRALKPVTCGNGLVIGDGEVIPELNFTLPPLDINDDTWPEVVRQYEAMISSSLQRAVDLKAPSLLVEFETLPPMTMRPQWGLEITRLLADQLKQCADAHGIRTALRLTPNDIREFERPPLMRRGKYWEAMVEMFDAAADAGADMIAIESTGGKEICDDALFRAISAAWCLPSVSSARVTWNFSGPRSSRVVKRRASCPPETRPAGSPTRRWSSPTKR